MLPIQDKAPVLAAIATTMKIIERRAKLFGLDSPVKQAYLFEDADAITDVTFRVIDTAEDVKKLTDAAHDAGVSDNEIAQAVGVPMPTHPSIFD